RAESLQADGARVAETPRDAAQDAEFVLSMVAEDNASRGVWLGANGALASVHPGTLLIESSTLSPGWIRELGRAAEACGATLLDAPVTGSKMQAQNGELSFLVGGDKQALKHAEPILNAMGKQIHYLGPSGSG